MSKLRAERTPEREALAAAIEHRDRILARQAGVESLLRELSTKQTAARRTLSRPKRR